MSEADQAKARKRIKISPRYEAAILGAGEFINNGYKSQTKCSVCGEKPKYVLRNVCPDGELFFCCKNHFREFSRTAPLGFTLGPDEREEDRLELIKSQPLTKAGEKYGCGHKSSAVILDDNELSLTAYFEWKESVGFDGDKSMCLNCWCKSQTAGDRGKLRESGQRGRVEELGLPYKPPATSGSTGEKTELEELEWWIDRYERCALGEQQALKVVLGGGKQQQTKCWNIYTVKKAIAQAEQRGYEASCDYDRCDALKERNAELIAKDKFYLDKLDKLKSENTKLKEHSFLLGLANSYITCMGAEPYVSRDKEIEAYNRSEGHRIEDPKRPYFNEHINRLKSENEKLRKKLKKKLK